MRRKRKRNAPTLVIVATTASLIAGCGGPAYEAICTDKTNKRIPERHCDNTNTNTTSGWYYYRSGSGVRVASIGQHATGGTRTPPKVAAHKIQRGGLPKDGGTITRRWVRLYRPGKVSELITRVLRPHDI